MSSLERRSPRWVEATLITLDEYARDKGIRPDVLKIDVEGHELKVLKGARQVLTAGRPIVIVETERPEVLELMSGLGYAPHRIDPDGELALHDGELDLTATGYENLCFLPE